MSVTITTSKPDPSQIPDATSEEEGAESLALHLDPRPSLAGMIHYLQRLASLEDYRGYSLRGELEGHDPNGG